MPQVDEAKKLQRRLIFPGEGAVKLEKASADSEKHRFYAASVDAQPFFAYLMSAHLVLRCLLTSSP